MSEHHLENAFVRVELDEHGDLTRVFDKTANREVLAPGAKGNELLAFEDRPNEWDAWDVDIFYDDKMWLAEPATSIRFVEYGELRQTLDAIEVSTAIAAAPSAKAGRPHSA